MAAYMGNQPYAEAKLKRKNKKVKCIVGLKVEKLQGELKSFPRRLYFGKFC